jgi:hypothetical protein
MAVYTGELNDAETAQDVAQQQNKAEFAGMDDVPTVADIEAATRKEQVGEHTPGSTVENAQPYTPGPFIEDNNIPYTPGPRWVNNSFPYEQDIEVGAVVFYEPDGSKKDARDEKKYLEEKGYTVTMVPVANGLSFANQWNYLPDSVAHVSIITHSHPWAMTFNKSSGVGVSVKNSAFNTSDDRARDDIYVEDLTPKDVTVRLMGCNTGHKDVPDNLAYAFSQIVSGDVYAADGNLKSGWLIFKANHGDTWNYNTHGSFDDYVPDGQDREPTGIYKYE